MELKLIADGLRVERGALAVIEGLSFAVAGGEALLLTGANGAGKTTLLRGIAGLIAPAAGTVRLEGGDGDATVGEQCHYVGHMNGLKASLTAAENLGFWARYLGLDGEDAGRRVRAALERLELSALAGIPAGYLSAGQKRRLGLARLLVAQRPVWLLDEPTVSLDAASAGVLAGVVAEHVKGGGIAVAATHLPLGIAGARELRLGARV